MFFYPGVLMRWRTLLLFVPLLSACDSFTGPSPFDNEGTYTLIAVDDVALPALLLESESSLRIDAVSGWLHMEKEVPGFAPEFTLSLTWRTSEQGGSRVDSAAYVGQYSRGLGNRFTLRFDGNSALCPRSGCGLSRENGEYFDSEFRFRGNPAEFLFRKR